MSQYNRDRDKASTSDVDCDTNTAKRTAFAELISYIQAALEDKDTFPVFQLSVLKQLYVDRVDQLGGDSSVIHPTRLKEKKFSAISLNWTHTTKVEMCCLWPRKMLATL